jgi:alkanesulfonate monooxygenase SsuD/methylene tetrahydromethanopterin reductase-like flavin-dependent oxidoreductase (luciferase family)
VILPAITSGAEKAGRSRREVSISVTAFAVTTPEERLFARMQIAFYASTPSYRPVMALHGWEGTAEQLSGLAARGRWDEMPALIDDEMLAAFAVESSPPDLPGALAERYRGLADRLGLYLPFMPGERDAFWRDLIKKF